MLALPVPLQACSPSLDLSIAKVRSLGEEIKRKSCPWSLKLSPDSPGFDASTYYRSASTTDSYFLPRCFDQQPSGKVVLNCRACCGEEDCHLLICREYDTGDLIAVLYTFVRHHGSKDCTQYDIPVLKQCLENVCKIHVVKIAGQKYKFQIQI